MLFDGARTAFTMTLLFTLWILTALIWVISDLSPLSSAENQIQIMNDAYGDPRK